MSFTKDYLAPQTFDDALTQNGEWNTKLKFRVVIDVLQKAGC
jgi:hypothetical protein